MALKMAEARRIWLRAQRLDVRAPFGRRRCGDDRAAVAHLGYVQIDTINVIERSHHHILFTRIPGYRREHLATAQSVDKSVFEYWTHALSYVLTADLRFFLPAMLGHRSSPSRWFGRRPQDVARLLRQIRGTVRCRSAISTMSRWRKTIPGQAANLEARPRTGVLRWLPDDRGARRHGEELRPRGAAFWLGATAAATASEGQVAEYLLERAIRAQDRSQPAR